MEPCTGTRRFVRRARAILPVALGLALLPLPANSGEKPDEAGPITVKARYSLQFNGIGVGRLTIKSKTTGDSYSVSGSAKVSVLFGAFTASGSSVASGAVERGTPVPATFSFDWQQSKKAGTTRIAFTDRAATEIAIEPKPRLKSDTVPLKPDHKIGALDPMSAVLMLTRADDRPPCDRRVGIFDGKQRYDVVLSPKRVTRIASAAGGAAETGYVCRITYEPVAGHRDNEDTRSYAANRDAEVVLRRIPGTRMLIPYSLTIPTAWGTGAMVTERIDIVTPGSGKIALTN
jgi:hypothetical protein